MILQTYSAQNKKNLRYDDKLKVGYGAACTVVIYFTITSNCSGNATSINLVTLVTICAYYKAKLNFNNIKRKKTCRKKNIAPITVGEKNVCCLQIIVINESQITLCCTTYWLWALLP